MSTGLEAVNWPVLRFGAPNCSMLMYEGPGRLARASASTVQAWSKMREYFLIDSTGMRYDLRTPVLLDQPSGAGKVMGWLFGTMRPVRWTVDVSGPLSVDEIRGLVFADFNEYEAVWQAYEIEELRRRLEGARTPRELVRTFGGS